MTTILISFACMYLATIILKAQRDTYRVERNRWRIQALMLSREVNEHYLNRAARGSRRGS